MEDYRKKTGINLKKSFTRNRYEVFECFKACVEEVLGYSLSEIEMKEVYAILFDLCLRKKNAMRVMINFSDKCEKKSISDALRKYKKQGRSYAKEDGEYCFSHVVMKIAKKLYFSRDEYKEVFRDQILDTRKKVGIKNSEAYLNRLIEEMDFISHEA